MNRVILTGNIVAEPEARTTTSGINNCTFRIAVQRRFKNAAGTYDADFLTVICWRQTADFVTKYLGKGRKVAVEGSIQTRNYEKDGQKVYVTEVIADSVEPLDKKAEGSSQTAPAQASNAGFTEVEVNTDELPF